MNKKWEAIAIISILLNITGIILITAVVVKRGGVSYVVNKIVNKHQNDNFDILKYPYYMDKNSLFDILKPKENSIMFVGDSITDNCEWHELLQEYPYLVLNRGIASDNTIGLKKRISNIISARPSKVFIMIGINDLQHGRSVEDTINNIDDIVSELKNNLPESKIYLQSVLPINTNICRIENLPDNSQIIELNKKISSVANQYNVGYIDLYSKMAVNDQLDTTFTNDGLHLNGKAYLVWKEAIVQYIY